MISSPEIYSEHFALASIYEALNDTDKLIEVAQDLHITNVAHIFILILICKKADDIETEAQLLQVLRLNPHLTAQELYRDAVTLDDDIVDILLERSIKALIAQV